MRIGPVKIGRLKGLTATALVTVALAAWLAWLIGGVTGLVIVGISTVLMSTGALAMLIVRTERRIQRMLASDRGHRGRSPDTRKHDQADAVSGGHDADALLTMIRASSLRTEKELAEAVKRELRAIRDELGGASNDLTVGLREVNLTHREIALVRAGVEHHNAVAAQTHADIQRAADEMARLVKSTKEGQAALLEQVAGQSRKSTLATFRRIVDEAVTEFDSLQRLYDRYPVASNPPPLGGWAIGPGTMLYVLEFVERNDISLVVECGPGASTVYLAEFFRRRGHGRVVSLEHDERFFEHVTRDLFERGLAEYAEVRLAPLTNTAVGGEVRRWYDPAALTGLSGIELLFVDGPPQSTGPLARYPAIPMFADHLAPGAVVIIDDAHRPGEQAAIERWTQESDWSQQLAPPGGFVVLGRSAPKPSFDESDVDPSAEALEGNAASDG